MAGSYGVDFVLPAPGIQSPSPSKGGRFGVLGVWSPELACGQCCEDNDFVEMFAGAAEVSASLRKVWVLGSGGLLVQVCTDCMVFPTSSRR